MDNMEVCVSFLDPRELTTVQLGALYTDYGYQVRIVEYGKDESDPESDVRINYDMAASMEWAWREIRKIQSAARSMAAHHLALAQGLGWCKAHGRQAN
jgi:phosphoketolase